MRALLTRKAPPERVAKATGSVEIVPRKPLALADRRLYNYLLAKAYQDLGKVLTHSVYLSEVRQYAASARGGEGDTDNRRLKDSITRLMGTVVEFNVLGSSDEVWEASQLLGPCKIEKSSGILTYSFPPMIVDRLREPALYSLINLKVVFQFDSKYALALYEILQRYADRTAADPYWSVRTEDLRAVMGCVDRLKDWMDFRRRAIDPALDEINRLAAFEVSIDEVRQGSGRGGGKVVGAVFRVRRKALDEAEAARREIEKPKVQRRGERKVRLEINAVAKALRWMEGSDAATRMRWQSRAEELGVIIPKGGIARENLPKWVPAIAGLVCEEEGLC